MEERVERAGKLRGTVTMPGDKSIAHRALIFGAMARGTQTISGLPPSQDVKSTISCLRCLGYDIEGEISGLVHLPEREPNSGALLDAGNSGTTARLLAGMISGLGLTCTIDGDASLRRRPMGRIVDPLQLMGARISSGADGCLPLQIQEAPLRGITYTMPVASAQVKSAILIAGTYAEGVTEITETKPSRNHTEVILRAMGIPIEWHHETAEPGDRTRGNVIIKLSGNERPTGIELAVPGDISSAAFFLTAGAIVQDSEIRLPKTGVNPSRTGLLDALKLMGARIELDNLIDIGGEPIADLVIQSSKLSGITIKGAMIPRLIDELPILAVAASQAEGTTVVEDAEELRYKESDRIAIIVDNLKRLGADITETADGFIINGPTPLTGGDVSSAGDHRIAMAMAVAGLVASDDVVIEQSDSVAVSYPGFFDDLRMLTL